MQYKYFALVAIPLLYLLLKPRQAYAKPLQTGKLSSKYGIRKNPVDGEVKLHNGIDIAAPANTPIYSVLSGVVSKVGSGGASGNFCSVESIYNDVPVTISYCHMIELPMVTEGQKVRMGQQVGKVGSTGRSTGNHLHLTFKAKGYSFDPLEIMPDLLP